MFATYTMQGGSPTGDVVSVTLSTCAVYLAQFTLLGGLQIAMYGLACPEVARIEFFGLFLVAGWTGVGAAVGGRVDTYSTRDFLVTATSLPVVFAAPLFYPITESNGWLAYVAAANPLTYQVEALRNLDMLAIALLVLWAFLGFFVAVSLLRRATRVSRER